MIIIPVDPLDDAFDVTEGLTSLDVGGFIPLGLAGAGALIFGSSILSIQIKEGVI